MLHGGAGRSLSGGKSLIGKSAAGSRLRHGIGEALGCGNRFVKVHGLTNEILDKEPPFRDIVDDFLAFIGDAPLVIHNAEFDMKFINAELSWIKRDPIPMDRTIDTLLIARRKFPGSRVNLDELCRRFDIDNTKRT